MRDPRNAAELEKLHPKARPAFQEFIEGAENGLDITIAIVQGMRTFAEQQAIYDQGRTTPGSVVTWSPPGASYHNYGLAIDVCPFVSGTGKLAWNFDFKKLLPYADQYGLTAGLNFPGGKTDPDHFEIKFGYNWRDLLRKYEQKDFIEGTEFVNI